MADLKLLVLDVDGVLTDGRITWGYTGDRFFEPFRSFHVHDGIAIQWFRRHLGEVAILTAKKSHAVTCRAEELGLQHVIQGSRDKWSDLQKLLTELGLDASQACMMGDDFPDLEVMRRVGYALAPANGAAEVRDVADFVTERNGGDAAVREAIEHLLKKHDKWSEVLAQYGVEGQPSGGERISDDGLRS